MHILRFQIFTCVSYVVVCVKKTYDILNLENLRYKAQRDYHRKNIYVRLHKRKNMEKKYIFSHIMNRDITII